MLSLCGSLICPLCNDFGYCMSSSIYCVHPELYPVSYYSDSTTIDKDTYKTSDRSEL